MSETSKFHLAELSRRSMLQNLAVAGSGAAMFVATVIGTREAAALTKAKQKVVAYQETPKGAQQCDNCKQFEPPSSCKVVEGDVVPTGWCKVYVKKPA